VDIVLTDVFMAGMDGLELTRLVKKMTDSDVIVMTGATNVVSSKEARAAGASIFFPKPVRLAKLLEGANLLIEKRKNKS